MSGRQYTAVPPAASGAAPALAVRKLAKRFPGVVALDDVSFEIGRGEAHALVGQNGAGKSTVINIVSGMLQPDAGEVLVGGQPVAFAGTGAAMAAGIVTVYQELSLLANLTVEQNIVLGREPRRGGLLDLAAMRARSRQVLGRMGLNIPGTTLVGHLPLAERQLIEIARAVASDPSVLILDEPTAPLGRAESERLFAAIRTLRDDGIAVLYVSHRFAEVLDLCDRVTVLRNGRKVITADLAGWTEARLTEAMIGQRKEAFTHSGPRAKGGERLRAEGLAWRGRVRGIDLVLRAGEILALTGLLGAGQNETARLLGGDLVADAGRIVVDGRQVAFAAPGDAIAAGICLLTEDRKGEGILPHQGLRENIALPSLARRRVARMFVDAGRERRGAQAARERFGVTAPSLAAPMRTLSGGNQQKALLARWDLAEADIFILIEPTRGVDVGARADIYRRLDGLARAGKAILVVSSDVPEVLALADRILVVRDGELIGEAPHGHVSEQTLNMMMQAAS